MKTLNITVIVLFLLLEQFLVNTQESSTSATILKSKFDQQPNGSYEFLFETSDGTNRREIGVFREDENHETRLTVVGKYSYFDPTGAIQIVYYKADEKGYRIVRPPNTRISVDLVGSLLGGL